MSILKALIVVTPLIVATAAAAASGQFTDSQYIAASRCQALMTSSTLGREDTKDIDAVMKSEGAHRSPDVADRADTVRTQADNAARHAGAYNKAALIAERDGACHTLFARGSMSASAESHGTTRTN